MRLSSADREDPANLTASQPHSPSAFRIAFVLALGLAGISFGSILVRFSQEAPSLTIAFYRMFWASLLFLPFYRRRTGGPVSWRVTLAAGTALALHFAFWIGSLRYTSVAVSILLLSTSPVLAALLSYLLYRERLSRRGVVGVGLTVLGSAVLVGNDLTLAAGWKGPLLALLGGLALAVYFTVGRGARQGMSLLEYVVPVYSTAALLLGAMVLASGVPWNGFQPRTWLFLFLLALVPQCIGHTSYNWSLKFLPATLVSVLALAEPVTASALAYWILDEALTPLILLGGVLLGAGILLVARWGTARPAQSVQVVVAILLREGQVLIQRRLETGHLDGYWEFPGGKIEAGETPRQAVAREIREEAGLELSQGDFEPLCTLDYAYPRRRLRLHFFLCRLKSGTVLKGTWVPVAKLDDYRFPPANAPILDLLKSL